MGKSWIRCHQRCGNVAYISHCIALTRLCCPSLSMKDVIELDPVIDVELVIGILH